MILLKIFIYTKNILIAANLKPVPTAKLNRSKIMTIILGYSFSNFDCFNHYIKNTSWNIIKPILHWLATKDSNAFIY